MSDIVAVAIVAVFTISILGMILLDVLKKIEAERAEWKAERRFLTDRAIARHVGEVVALDRMDVKREAGEPDKAHTPAPSLPEGL